MRNDHFTVLGLPCRQTDDRTVYDAYQRRRRQWFLRQYEPEHLVEAPGRLRRLDDAYAAIRDEGERRRYLARLISADPVLRNRRHSELGRLARDLARRETPSAEARRLLRSKALGLDLAQSDANKAFESAQRFAPQAVASEPQRPSPSHSPTDSSPSWSASDKFRFAVRVVASQGAIDERRRRHLLTRACHLGIPLDRAERVLEKAHTHARRRRPGWLARLWGVLKGNLDLDAC